MIVKTCEVTQIVIIRSNFCDFVIIYLINADECMKNQVVHDSLSVRHSIQNFERSLSIDKSLTMKSSSIMKGLFSSSKSR